MAAISFSSDVRSCQFQYIIRKIIFLFTTRLNSIAKFTYYLIALSLLKKVEFLSLKALYLSIDKL